MWRRERTEYIITVILRALYYILVCSALLTVSIWLSKRQTLINKAQNTLNAYDTTKNDSLLTEAKRLHKEALNVPLNPFK